MSSRQEPDAVSALRIAHVQHACRTLGPGLRSVVWVRGCGRRCPGCVAGPILDREGPGERCAPEALAARLLSRPDEDGVTFSGGEPMEQAEALAEVAARVQAAGRSVMVYTGHRLEELRRTPGARALLEATDILVDGPFVEARQADLLWRGSDNQRVHLLTARARAEVTSLSGTGAGLELRVSMAGRLFWIGVPAPGALAALGRAAASRGLTLTDFLEGGP